MTEDTSRTTGSDTAASDTGRRPGAAKIERLPKLFDLRMSATMETSPGTVVM